MINLIIPTCKSEVKIESFQYNAALEKTGAVRGTSKEKLYQELGLKSLRSKR